MDHQDSETVVGFSVFDLFEECYEYNENACYIADSKKRAEIFVKDGCTDASADDCRIDTVTFGDIMRNYGRSCGEYAMESQAFAVFKRIAELNGVTFTFEPFEGDVTLLVVRVNGVRIRNEEDYDYYDDNDDE